MLPPAHAYSIMQIKRQNALIWIIGAPHEPIFDLFKANPLAPPQGSMLNSSYRCRKRDALQQMMKKHKMRANMVIKRACRCHV